MLEVQKLPPFRGKSLTQIKKILKENGWNFGYWGGWGKHANIEVWLNNVDNSIVRIDKTGNVVPGRPDAIGIRPHIHKEAEDLMGAGRFDDNGILVPQLKTQQEFEATHILIKNYWFDQYQSAWLNYNLTGDMSEITQLYFLRFSTP